MPRTITIQSVQVGRLVTEGDPSTRDALTRQWTTGFYKRPVDGPVRLGSTGLSGDAVADRRFHGSSDKAVLAYASAHYAAWRSEHPEVEFVPGGFAENLTVAGADESGVCIGDRYRCGDAVIEVSQPRQPCWKISRRWGIKTLTKEVTKSGRTGWYCRVIEEGMIESGVEMELIERASEGWTVARANDLMYGREVDRMAVIELMGLPRLSDEWKEGLS